MSEPLKKTYTDYLELGYEVVSAYYGDGSHFHVLQSNENVVIAKLPYPKGGFMMDADIEITRLMK